MGRKILKLWIEINSKDKYVALIKTRNGEKKIENLTGKQVEQLWRFLKGLGFGVFIYGKRREIEGIRVSDYAKVYTDDTFKTRKKLPIWEVYDG
jgi:3'-phosphoadenosine 5'-phosphosulfate sulfotransferase (PAPS reductase)/FAD synthetase